MPDLNPTPLLSSGSISPSPTSALTSPLSVATAQIATANSAQQLLDAVTKKARRIVFTADITACIVLNTTTEIDLAGHLLDGAAGTAIAVYAPSCEIHSGVIRAGVAIALHSSNASLHDLELGGSGRAIELTGATASFVYKVNTSAPTTGQTIYAQGPSRNIVILNCNFAGSTTESVVRLANGGISGLLIAQCVFANPPYQGKAALRLHAGDDLKLISCIVDGEISIGTDTEEPAPVTRVTIIDCNLRSRPTGAVPSRFRLVGNIQGLILQDNLVNCSGLAVVLDQPAGTEIANVYIARLQRYPFQSTPLFLPALFIQSVD